MCIFIIRQMMEEAGEVNKKRNARSLMSVTMYAKKLGVHRSTVIRWVKSGMIEHTRTKGGHIRIDPKEEPIYS